MFDDVFLARQQEYYNARAGEYDEWWERRGRYDRGPAENAAWAREQAVLLASLAALPTGERILELACGTGNWTLPLSRRGARVTAVDGSAEMLALNRDRVRPAEVEYVRADLFAWEPEQRYDLVVCCFWLSHVPPERLDEFLGKVRRALLPGGRFFFVDSRSDPASTTPDQALPPDGSTWLVRRLNDGREFPIVKVFFEPDALRARLAACGFEADVRRTERFFIYGTAVPGTQ